MLTGSLLGFQGRKKEENMKNKKMEILLEYFEPQLTRHRHNYESFEDYFVYFNKLYLTVVNTTDL